MAMRLCDNGGPAARKYGDLDGAVNRPAAAGEIKIFTSLVSEKRGVTRQSYRLFYAPTFRMKKSQ
jgi:hypothetical protein